ncbi:YcjX family GTP-binding protein [Limimaricola litoreus]|uniref:YcjX family protein n=1 Tax=Limimaricola litoreus TaxID=2955316 RepID=A0A9X2JT84_9RHOB|nr:YcjX family protein [Limimaricola litoreus]MCP1170476.1 YcjX family protein [Limimaricola litoreus]
MVIGTITEGITRGVEGVADRLAAPFSDPVLRLGVTGLSRAGKTVFITSLVANLMDRGRMPQFAAGSRILGAVLQPQPDDTVARFDYEGHLAQLLSPEPSWPEGTRRASALRLSLRVQQGGLLAGVQGPKTMHLDIVDYPGEWLLDLGLIEKDHATWAREALARVARRAGAIPEAAAFHEMVGATDPAAPFDEPRAKALAQGFTAYLNAAREAGYSDCTPGRFLLPGDLEGSPVLTFAPLPGEAGARGSLGREMARRYEAYKREVVKPFFRDHFARIDRQVVLVDVLSAIHAGPQAVEDLRAAMADILRAFRPGRNAFLSRIFQGRRIDRILFAATKADHLHHSEHAKLAAITEALLRDARDRADFAGARTQAMSIAALRTTVEDRIAHGGEEIDVVRGKLLDTGRQAALNAGALPEDPSQLLAPARAGAETWLDGDYAVMNFAPARLSLKPGEGPPHIRLDRAAEFLLGDRL